MYDSAHCPTPSPNWHASGGKNRFLSVLLPGKVHNGKLKERNMKLTDGRYFGHCNVLSKGHHFPLKANVIDKATSFFSTSSRK